MIEGRGYVQKYYCDCQDPGNPAAICWIVRYPDVPSISYTTEHGARTRLGQLRKQHDS